MTDDELDRKQIRMVVVMLATERKRLGISPAQLSLRTGISRSNIEGIERGAQKPRIETLQRYARGIGQRIVVTIGAGE